MSNATPSAHTAITLLEKLQASCSVERMAYWTVPNVILTLSGARGYADGVYWEDAEARLEQWNTEIGESLEVLKTITRVTACEYGIKQQGDERYASFDIILDQGLDYVTRNSTLFDTKPIFDAVNSPLMVMDTLADALRKTKTYKDQNEDDIRHSAFGILVGYPDQAITESVALWGTNDPFAEPLTEADIRGAGYYVCPQPVYSYPRHLVSDPKINAHERLWSQILRDYYRSDFHATLEKNRAYMAKMAELKNLR